MWALGCVLYEMAAQKPPFTAPDVSNLYKKICCGIFQRIPYEYSNDLASVISSLLKLNPNDRPSAGSLLCSDIVQSRYEGELK
jgi:NIMA (never in mitosis gene a)-related kinase